ncbi:hypothetical protein [Pedobacter xixiisoli]|uniref:Uncharacterized protein n=1 Tax=Pedobacter xixiisoli TaxID=1476464 RepID=A0A286A7Z4_9SPHI|nr:hypothetical protein [Pedobacter xixiisoli]SOD18040.1 hypothetical protein SAMN06297358_2795 [Pedobacter xixiisoli]
MERKFVKFSLLLLIVAFVVSCKKNKDEISGEKDKEHVSIKLEANAEGFKPLALVQVKLTDILVDKFDTNGTLLDKSVKIAVINNTANFLVPEVQAGSYDLNFTVKDQKYVLNLKVIASGSVSEATVYADQIASGVEKSITELKAQSNNDQLPATVKASALADAEKYKALFEEYGNEYNQLNAAEKMVFAKVIAANMDWIQEIKSSLASINKSAQGLKSSRSVSNTGVQDYEQQQSDLIEQWLRSTYSLTRNIAKLTAVILVMPVTGAIPLIGTIGTGVALAYMATAVLSSLSQNLAILGQLMEVTFAPYQNLTFGDFSTEVYNNAQAKVYTASASFRKLMTNDETNAELGATLKGLLSTYNAFKTEIGDLLNKLPAKFKPNISIAGLKSSIQSAVRGIHNKYISVTNISNSRVQLAVDKQADGTVKLTASTTATTDQTFTYDISYANTSVSSNSMKKTITATVKAEVDSTQIYVNAVVGNWRVTNVDTATPYTYDLVINAGGTGYYTAGTSKYAITWSIIKREKKYYLFESGFWHPGFNQFRVYGKGFSDEGLTYPVTGFKHYSGGNSIVSLVYQKN